MNTADGSHEFDALLDYLKRSRGFDFTGYKRPSLMRRIQKRMQILGVERFSDFIDRLEVYPEEFAHLFNMILINVTSFFRDAPTWDYLGSEVIPRILAGKRPEEPIRVWSAGCASGEEAFTAAMVLAEVLGVDQFHQRVKIYATDVDLEALGGARQASFSGRDVIGIPARLLDQYFERVADRYVFRKDLRRLVIFGRHDLIQDAPISRIDLLVCRNTLMYFNTEAQARILGRFHFALNDTGFLVLGKAEMLFTHTQTFAPVDLKRRVFAKVPKVNLRDRLLLMAPPGGEETTGTLFNQVRIREAAFDAGLVAQFVVDLNGTLALANDRARGLFGLTPQDLGRPVQDLELSYRPVELRSCIEQVHANRRPILVKDVEWPAAAGDARSFDAHVAPLLDPGGGLAGVSVSFLDTTRVRCLQEELLHSSEELETAYEELQSTNEELETTNEELQSTNEELETTNEELQSTNEELETMNEELQSTNEELQAINGELHQRSDELNQVNGFLETILSSLRDGVVVVDRELHVRAWSRGAEDLWGLRADDVVGKPFLNLEVGLPMDQLKQPVRACLAGESNHREVIVAATNRRGQAIQCQISFTPLAGGEGPGQGVILVMEERDGTGAS